MAQMIERTSTTPSKDVLLAPHLAFTIGIQVSNTGVSTVNGKKIIPAGTPIGGTTSALLNRETVLKVDGTNPQGILRNDVDVTNGNANAQLIVTGVIDVSKCPSTLDATAMTALAGRFTFIDGGAE